MRLSTKGSLKNLYAIPEGMTEELFFEKYGKEIAFMIRWASKGKPDENLSQIGLMAALEAFREYRPSEPPSVSLGGYIACRVWQRIRTEMRNLPTPFSRATISKYYKAAEAMERGEDTIEHRRMIAATTGSNDLIGLSELEASDPPVGSDIERRDMFAFLRRKIQSALTEKQSDAILRFYGIGMPRQSLDEIAAVRGISSAGVHNNVKSGIERLRKILPPHFAEALNG